MADSELRYLFSGGSADITPPKKIPLAGFDARTEPFTGVGDPLEVDAIVLNTGSAKVVFVTADLLYIGSELRAEVLRRLKGAVRDEELFISSTHNHYAPATDPSKPLLGKTDDEYLAFVAERVSRLVESALAMNPKPVTVSYYVGTNLDCSINRRRFSRMNPRFPRREMDMIPNANGCRDPAIRVLRFFDLAGGTVAIAWNYCCHPVAHPVSNNVSSHYPGAVRAALRSKYGTDVLIVFWQGFSGDVRPRAFRRRPKVLSRSFPVYVVFRILSGRRFGLFTREEWKQWANKLSDSVVRASMDGSGLRLGVKLNLNRIAVPLWSMGFESEDELVFHEVMLGGLRIIGLSAEPVAEYVPILEDVFPGELFIPVGCIDKTTLYLPTKDMLSEGGYEVDGFATSFGISGKFSRDFQDKVEKALRSL